MSGPVSVLQFIVGFSFVARIKVRSLYLTAACHNWDSNPCSITELSHYSVYGLKGLDSAKIIWSEPWIGIPEQLMAATVSTHEAL